MKTEFSKIILIISAVITILMIVFSCYMMIVTQDLSPLSYIIPSIFGEMSIATGFYFNKAKAENKIKLMKDNGIQIDKEDINQTE